MRISFVACILENYEMHVKNHKYNSMVLIATISLYFAMRDDISKILERKVAARSTPTD